MSKSSAKLLVFIQDHIQAAQFSFNRLLVSPAATFLTIAVIAIALALPAGMYCALSNLTHLCDHWHPSNQISLYLKDPAEARSLVKKIETLPGIDSVNYISPEDGLIEFEKALGINNVLSGLKNNPIPATLQIHPKPLLTDRGQLEAIKIQLSKLPGVDKAKLDTEWVQRLNDMLSIAERSLLALSAIFSLAVMLVISNTIRLNIENQKQEINIMALIGATHPYIRRPFLYHGLMYGALSGLFAWAWINLLIAWLRTPANHLSMLYHSTFRLHGFNLYEGITLMIISGMLGLIAASLVMHHHFNQMT